MIVLLIAMVNYIVVKLNMLMALAGSEHKEVWLLACQAGVVAAHRARQFVRVTTKSKLMC